MDEMWSLVQSKGHQRWLWHAIDHQSGEVLAYVLAPYEDQALKTLIERLTAKGSQPFYTDRWRAYLRLLDAERHTVGKANTQRIGAQTFDLTNMGQALDP